MAIANDYEYGWFSSRGPTQVTNTSGTSGTFQANSVNYKALHAITSPSALYLLQGTGSSVSVTTSTGLFWPANTPFFFYPETACESLGWLTSDSTGAAGASAKVTVACVSKKV